MKRLISLLGLGLILLLSFACELIEEPEWNNPFYPVIGPALVLNPVEIDTKANDSFSITVRFEEIHDVMGLHAEIHFDHNRLELSSYHVLENETELLASNNATLLYFVEMEPGKITVDIGLANGSPAGISGSGDVVELVFTAWQAGDTYLSFGPGCRITNQDLNDIPIFQTRGGAVYVSE